MQGLLRVLLGVFLASSCGGRSERDAAPIGASSGGAPIHGGAKSSGGNASGGSASGGSASGGSASGGTESCDANAAGSGAKLDLVSECPGEPTLGPMPEVACATTVETCSCRGAVSNSCNFSQFSVTLAEASHDCGIYCGQMSIGMRSGCVAALNPEHFGVSAWQTPGEAETCVRQRLTGTRWSCAPTEGWVSIYLGSCTTL